jgi:hypothetical protein
MRKISALPHQLVRLPRGDSTLVAVAFSVRAGVDTALQRDSLLPFVAALQHGGRRVGSGGEDSQQGVLWMTIASDTAIASIEVRGAKSKRAARARYTIDPVPRAGAFALSDLLLFDPARYAGTSIDTLMAEATTDPRFSARAPLGVYWELEGTPSTQPVWLNLLVEPMRVGLVRRLATRLHLAREFAPVRLRWQAVFQRSREGQSVTLRMPAGARGKYRVVLTVEPPESAPLTASREVEILP